MTDAIVGWITGNKFCEDPGIQVYINSLLASGYEGEKIIFTAEMTPTLERQLKDKNFTYA